MKIKIKNTFFHRKAFMLFIMRTFLFLFCTVVFGFSPIKIFSQNTKITIKTDKIVTIDEVFELISKQTKFTFIYQEDLFKNAPKVELKKGVIEVNKLLEKIISNENFEIVTTKNNTISIKKRGLIQPTTTVIQQIITGKISDVSGMPLSGVTVTVKQASDKSNSVAITNSDGTYSIMANKGATIIYTHIGFETQTILISDEIVINVSMGELPTEMGEVYVTGYKTIKKERATGSFSKGDMSVFKSRRGTQNVMSRLEGMIPGLTVSSGPNGSNIIRGISSINLGREPLYVIDGVIVSDFSVINPEDIGSVTVLKDAAAAAIWGSKAANGVIVITTKKGKHSEDIKINYNSYLNIQGKPDFGYSRMLNSQQYIQAARETFNPNNIGGALAPHENLLYDTYLNPANALANNASLDNLANTDNTRQIKKLWYRDAVAMGHNFSISGGSLAHTFYSSVSYIDTQSNRPGDKENNYSISLNQDYTVNKSLKLGLNIALRNTISSSKRPINIGNSFLPYQLFQDADGNSINMPFMLGWTGAERLDFQERSRINLDYYPLDEMNYGHSKSNNLSLNLTGNVELKLFKGLSYNGTYGYLKTPGKSKRYDDYKSLNKRQQLLGLTIAPDISSTPIYLFPTTGGTYVESSSEQRYWSLRNQLVYTANPREGKDRLDLQVGQEANEQLSSQGTTTLEGYNEALQTYAYLDYVALGNYMSNVVSPYGGSYNTPFYEANETVTRLTSYFALASYMINAKYGIDCSWRADQSNLFGSDKSAQNRPVWSIGGKWQLSKENFMKSITWMDNLSLRATYGITGNSPYAGSASSFDIISSSTSPFSGNIAGSYFYLWSPANKKLSWESTKTINFGIDFSLFSQRVSGSIDVYKKNTSSLLGQVPLNAFTGSSSSLGNIGSLMNRGIELNLTTINIKTKNFNWSSNFVFSYNQNKLIDYSATYVQTASDLTSLAYLSGYSMQPLFAYNFVGLDNMGDPLIQLADGTITKDPNAAQVKDMKYMGTKQPVFNGGLSNTFSYKGFSLTANMIYNLGHVMRGDVNTFYSGRLTGSNSFNGTIHPDFADRWQVIGDEASTNIPSYESDGYINYFRRNTSYYTQGDVNVLSASYIKLREITFSYNISESALSFFRLDSFSLSFQIGNFMIWKANKVGIDPEHNDDFNFGSRETPQSKHPVTFGINISF